MRALAASLLLAVASSAAAPRIQDPASSNSLRVWGRALAEALDDPAPAALFTCLGLDAEQAGEPWVRALAAWRETRTAPGGVLQRALLRTFPDLELPAEPEWTQLGLEIELELEEPGWSYALRAALDLRREGSSWSLERLTLGFRPGRPRAAEGSSDEPLDLLRQGLEEVLARGAAPPPPSSEDELRRARVLLDPLRLEERVDLDLEARVAALLAELAAEPMEGEGERLAGTAWRFAPEKKAGFRRQHYFFRRRLDPGPRGRAPLPGLVGLPASARWAEVEVRGPRGRSSLRLRRGEEAWVIEELSLHTGEMRLDLPRALQPWLAAPGSR